MDQFNLSKISSPGLSRLQIAGLAVLAVVALAAGLLAFHKSPELKSFDNDMDPFTLKYPADLLEISYGLNTDGRTIVFESNKGMRGFEVVAIPVDDPRPMTAARFLSEESGFGFINVADTSVAGEPAISFDSVDEAVGPLYQVWFIRDSWLFQVRCRPDFIPEFTAVLKTWRFK